MEQTALPGLTRGTDQHWRLVKEKEGKRENECQSRSSEQNIHSLGWRRESDSGLQGPTGAKTVA
jgi:hypothetical protein